MSDQNFTLDSKYTTALMPLSINSTDRIAFAFSPAASHWHVMLQNTVQVFKKHVAQD